MTAAPVRLLVHLRCGRAAAGSPIGLCRLVAEPDADPEVCRILYEILGCEAPHSVID